VDVTRHDFWAELSRSGRKLTEGEVGGIADKEISLKVIKGGRNDVWIGLEGIEDS